MKHIMQTQIQQILQRAAAHGWVSIHPDRRLASKKAALITPPTDERKDQALRTLLLAIEHMNGITEFARSFGQTPELIVRWRARGGVPIHWAPIVEAVCNHPEITCETLCPDHAEYWDLLRAVFSKPKNQSLPLEAAAKLPSARMPRGVLDSALAQAA